MTVGQCLFLFTVGVVLAFPDFQESYWNDYFIYHEDHDLMLVIDYSNEKCFFSHVTNKTREVFDTCHRSFIEAEIYHVISWGETEEVTPSTMAEMRAAYGDALANYRCADKQIYNLTLPFGDNYIKQCEGLERIGK